MDPELSLESFLLHADVDPDDSSIAPAIHQTVPFSAASADEFVNMNQLPLHARSYRRYSNPTQARLESVVSALEGAELALATGAGMGAISTTVLALLSCGEHIVAQRSMYGGTLTLLRTIATRLGIETTFVDQTDPDEFAGAITDRTRLFLLESPSNPLLQITDLKAVTQIAKEHGILTAVDNTIATPVNQRPLEHGADLVIHSVTKALSGHSDVLAGMVLGGRELIERIWATHILVGSIISPVDAWLALRGLRTLALRVAQQEKNAIQVARYLEQHPAVRTVNYPGLRSHPQHDRAVKQMAGHGALLSFELRGGHDAAEELLGALRLPARSSSLGGFRSLIVQPAAMWTGPLDEGEIEQSGVSAGLVRLAVGLESEKDLIADLERALTDVGG